MKMKTVTTEVPEGTTHVKAYRQSPPGDVGARAGDELRWRYVSTLPESSIPVTDAPSSELDPKTMKAVHENLEYLYVRADSSEPEQEWKDGVPPIGTMVNADPEGVGKYFLARVVAHHQENVVCFMTDDNFPVACGLYQGIDKSKIRPLDTRSPRDRAIEAAMDIAAEVIGTEIDPIRKDIFGALFDAGLLKGSSDE